MAFDRERDNFVRDYQGDRLIRMQAKNGGSLFDFISKVPAGEPPTLIVSLGGLGARTLNEIKRLYNLRIDDPEQRVQFLAVDVDGRCLEPYLKFNSDGFLDPAECCGIVADPSTVSGLPEAIPEGSPEKQWLEPEFPEDCDLLHSRQGVRLALSVPVNYNALAGILAQKAEIVGAGGNPGCVSVIFIAGLSGAAGGIAVDLAYMIRLALRQCFGPNAALQFDACFFTPEVHQLVNGVNMDRLRSNFTAAMKEIDTYFKQGDAGVPYRFPCDGNDDGRLRVAGKDIGEEDIFTSCTLVQGFDSIGGIRPLEETVSITARYVINGIGSFSVTDGGFRSVQLVESLVNNDLMGAAMSVSELTASNPLLPRDTLYKYRALGFRELDFPVEELMTYLVNQTMIRLQDKFDKEPETSELEVLAGAGVAYAQANNVGEWMEANDLNRSYTTLLKSCGVNLENAGGFIDTLEFSKVRKTPIEELAKGIKPTEDCNQNWLPQALAAVTIFVRNEMQRNGPFAALRLSRYTLDKLQEMIGRGPRIKQALEQEADAAQNALQEAYSAIAKGGLFHRNERLDAFKEAARAYYVARSRANLCSGAEQCLQTLLCELTKTHDNEWGCYVGAFCAIADILRKDSTAALEEAQRRNENCNVFSAAMIDLVAVSRHNGVLGKAFEHWLGPAYIDRICNKLISKMLDSRDAWMPYAETFSAPEQLRNIFMEVFYPLQSCTFEKLVVLENCPEPGGDATVEDLLEVMAETLDDETVSEDARWKNFDSKCITKLGMNLSPLESAAAVISRAAMQIGVYAAQAIPGIPLDSVYTYRVLCLPNVLPHINERIKQRMEMHFPGTAVAEGDFAGCFNLEVYCGLPLYFFKGMEESQLRYEEAYAGKSALARAGLHMDCSPTAGGRAFPPIVCNQALRLIFAAGKEDITLRADYIAEERMMQDVKAKTDACIAFGMICFDEENSLWNLTAVSAEGDEPHDALLGQYRTRAAEAAKEHADADALAKALEAVPLRELMQEAGYRLKEVPLRLTADYVPQDCSSRGDYNSPDEGGLYRVIRRAGHLRMKLDACYSCCEALRGELAQILEEVLKQS